MDRPQLPLNALRAFEAAARHRNFTRAAIELCVSQAALSHQVPASSARRPAQTNYANVIPVIVPVLVPANRSTSNPNRCSIDTNRFVSG